MRLLIAGLSTRAAAESAARAGFQVTAIDAFGDLDQHPDVRSLSVPHDVGGRPTATALARVARSIECDAVAYLSSFENHPRAVATLAAGRTLLGNPPDVLRRVRDPLRLADALRRRGFAVPAVRLNDPNDPNDSNDSNDSNDPNDWLIKPFASGGGRGVEAWRPVKGPPTPRVRGGSYLQELIDGVPGSVVFVSAGGRCVPLGVSRQLVGEPAFGARGYRYCGSILAAPAPVAPERLAAAVTEAFGLTGLNGIDFIARDGVPYPIEVNPRWSSSMELVERAFGMPLFALHASACLDGKLPAVSLGWGRPVTGTLGKAVVFARRDVVMGDTRPWLEDPTVRDVPHPGEHMRAGRPICTVFADGPTDAECHAALVDRAERIYAEVGRFALTR